MNDFINENEIRKTLAILKPDNQLFEVRIVGTAAKKTLSGYFKDADTLLKAFKTVNLRNVNVYLTLNFINEGCYARIQHDSFQQGVQTTGDTDITGYQWLMIDLDPDRTSGTSSSSSELQAAADMAAKVYKYLFDIGFEEPVKALSGNGYHLLYRINLKNTSENAELVHQCLETLSSMFSSELVKVDTTVSNPSRICKLHGTLAQKGTSTADRPHRMSRILSDSVDVKITSKAYLEKLVAQLPKESEKPKQTTYQAERFDIISFMNRHGMGYRQLSQSGRDNSTVYALDECPFDCNHRDGDAKIFEYPDGRISFTCHHNSCDGKKWPDVRRLFEPNAYDYKDIDRRIDEGWRQHNRDKQEVIPYEPIETETPAAMFRTAKEIYEDDEPVHEFIRSGIDEIDRIMHGFQKQSISMISGLRASGKSTLIGSMILQAVQDKHTVVVYSGELSNKKYLSWITRQAAGEKHVEVSTEHTNAVGISDDNCLLINDWLGSRFWLYNNEYGNNFRKIADRLRTVLKEKQADLCIIDNLMALDLTDLNKGDKYEAQTRFVWELKEIAALTNTHIVFVAHPKKVTGFIRLDDVSGTGNITNIVDNAFMVHRCNLDFQKRFKETFGIDPIKKGIPEDATNVIEIAKDRENGTMDEFIPLWFEPKSKRLRNNRTETIHYRWEPDETPSFSEPEVIENGDLPFRT